MNVIQEWVQSLPMMQQTVLLTAVRGPDGVEKYNSVKYLLRWYRRCLLLSATDGKVLDDPYSENGGSFTGPSWEHPSLLIYGAVGGVLPRWEEHMDNVVGAYLRGLDGIPHHFHMHLMHAIEIMGYRHPDVRIGAWWMGVYYRLVSDMHLHPETREELDRRLGDTREGWLERADPATQK